MPVDSLLEIARRAAAKSIRSITDIGDCPYELARSILLKIENPVQLRQLEQNSPQVVGKTQEIWLNLIKRDIPNWENKVIYPNNPDNWWKVYRKLKKDLKRDNDAGEALLKARLSGMKNEREENFAQLTTKRPAPGVAKRARIAYSHTGGRASGGRSAAPTNFFEKMRKDAGQRPSTRMATPTHKLTSHSTKITKAPLAMVEEIRAQKQSPPPKASTTSSRSAPLASNPSSTSKTSKAIAKPYDMTQDRENRLRRLKAGQQVETNIQMTGIPNLLSEDFLEDDDDIFRESTFKKPLVTMVRAPRNRHLATQMSPDRRSGKRKEPPSEFNVTAKRLER